MRLYVNGSIVAETITVIRPFRELDPNYNPGVGIGNTQGNSSYNHPFHGIIDELSVYDRALSENEIKAIFKVGNSGKCK